MKSNDIESYSEITESHLADDKFYNLYLSKAKHSETEEEYRYWLKLADKRELKLQGVTNKPVNRFSNKN